MIYMHADIGANSTTYTAVMEVESNLPTGAIVGGAVGTTLLLTILCLIVIALVFARRNRGRPADNRLCERVSTKMIPVEMNESYNVNMLAKDYHDTRYHTYETVDQYQKVDEYEN